MHQYISPNDNGTSAFSEMMGDLKKIRMENGTSDKNSKLSRALQEHLIDPVAADKFIHHANNPEKLLILCKVAEQVKAGICTRYKINTGLFSAVDNLAGSKQTVLKLV